MSRRLVSVVVGALLVAAALLLWWSPWSTTGQVQVRIAGVDAGVPRAEAESEFVLDAALDAARDEAQRAGAQAFIVHRRGHRIFEYYADGRSGASMVEGGALGAAVLRLALLEPGDDDLDVTQAATLISERIWLPLRAGDAWLRDPGTALRQCCIDARIDDWMRVGDLLNGHGTYLGERLVSADAARQLLAGNEMVWRGDEPLLARDGTAFDLQPGLRLWMAPQRALTVLVWTDEQHARDTLLANIILRGLNDASPAIGGDISDLVPGH